MVNQTDDAPLTIVPPSPPYRILTASSSQELEEKVIKEIKNGMQPLGYPFIFKDHICQTMQSRK